MLEQLNMLKVLVVQAAVAPNAFSQAIYAFDGPLVYGPISGEGLSLYL